MVTLFCAIVGVKGSVFSVDIDASQSVNDLKKVIKKEMKYKFAADELKLYLAKRGDVWLTEKEVDEEIRDMSDFKPLKVVAAPLHLVGLSEKDVAFEITTEDVKTKNSHVHVLVVAKNSVTVVEGQDTKKCLQELMYYQHCGRLIQDKCRDYCAHILDKVDTLYAVNKRPMFICVQGSKGMGKSQLAFALGGR